MAYQRKPIGSPCSRCGQPVAEERVAVRTLTNYLPYTPKIWHRPCFEEHKRETAGASAGGRALAPAA
jgi:hypothetical protein